MTSTDVGLAIMLVMIGFWIGGTFALRQAKSGKMLRDHGIGPPIRDAVTTCQHMDGMPRVEQMTVMLAVMQTLTPGELQVIREKAREQPHSVFAMFAQEPNEEDQMMFASEMPSPPPEPLYAPVPEPVREETVPSPQRLRKMRSVLTVKPRRIDLT